MKAFLSDECKETEENNRMGKTGDIFKKIRNSKGSFHAKTGTMKDRNCMDLKKKILRWEEYTEELYKKDLHNPDNHNGVITHLEPVKWALGSITINKASGGDGIPGELFQILKCESAVPNMPANLENSAMATRLKKISFHSNPKEMQCQRMLKLPHNCTHPTG